MMLAAVLRAKAEGLVPAGDIILTIMADEEGGQRLRRASSQSSTRAVRRRSLRHRRGGGSSQTIFGQRYYLIAVAEKQVCWMRAAERPGGQLHALAQGCDGEAGPSARRWTNRLPVHITPVAERMIAALAEAAPAPQAELLRLLLDPERTDAALDELAALGVPQAHARRSAAQHGQRHGRARGDKTNVIPSRADLEIDGPVVARLHARRF